MNLILGGGGDEKDAAIIHKYFFNLLTLNKKVLYIPVAWENGDFDSCRAWFESAFSEIGLPQYEMWTDLSGREYEDLHKFGGLFIGGGNTNLLLKTLRDTNFYDLIEQFVQSDRPVFGGSAGAIIFGKTIESSGDINNVRLDNFDGFNFVSDYNLWCHYEVNQDDSIRKFVQNKNIPVIALSERSGLLVANGKIKVIGLESTYTFLPNGKSEYITGSRL